MDEWVDRLMNGLMVGWIEGWFLIGWYRKSRICGLMRGEKEGN